MSRWQKFKLQCLLQYEQIIKVSFELIVNLTILQADVLTQIERLYSEFQSHSAVAERARTHEFPLVSNPMIWVSLGNLIIRMMVMQTWMGRDDLKCVKLMMQDLCFPW